MKQSEQPDLSEFTPEQLFPMRKVPIPPYEALQVPAEQPWVPEELLMRIAGIEVGRLK